MRQTIRQRQGLLCSVFALGLLCTLLTARTAHALPTDLIISEYIEGSSNNKALEIYNGTGAPVDLTALDYTIEMYFNGATTPNLTHHLTGTIANNDVFVLANPSSVNAGILAAQDQTTSSSAWYNGNDVVMLRKNNGAAIVDVFGQLGFAGTAWGSAPNTTVDHTLRRKASVCAGDTVANDVFDPAIQWDFVGVDDASQLGSHSVSCGGGDVAPTVASTFPVNGGTMTAMENLSVTFSEPVSVTAASFTLSCSVSGTVPMVVSGGPVTLTLDPSPSLVNDETCTLTIAAALVVDLDGTPNAMASNATVDFTVGSGCGSAATAIHDIQGSGTASPMLSSVVQIEGVVVGDFQGASGLRGFFLEAESSDFDDDAETSEGIFVFDNAGAVSVSVGDVVRVRGRVVEFCNGTCVPNRTLTEVEPLSPVAVCSSGAALPPVQNITFPLADPVANVPYLERFEGMLVATPSPMYVTETYNQGHFGEVKLSVVGQLFTPTNVVAPGAPAIAYAAQNARQTIFIDDGSSLDTPGTVAPWLGPNGTLRLGDAMNGVTGVLRDAFGFYEIEPTSPSSITITTNNPRPMPPSASGRLKVAAYNVLNYFTTLDTGGTPCGPCGGLECRGANTAAEFTRQQAKTQAALRALDADIYGLAELENNPSDSLNSIVSLLPAGYAAVNLVPESGCSAGCRPLGTIGGDAIKVGFVYKTSKVEVVGTPKCLTHTVDPAFLDEYNRPVLAVTFRELATGEKFTAAMVHLKSKGSACSNDPDLGDGQGNCNVTRRDAAAALARWLSHDPTGSVDTDFLLLGDFNAYVNEDPIVALENASYRNEVKQRVGAQNYDFVFEGEAGSLSNMLTSPTLRQQVSDVIEWHINAPEPRAFDYNDYNQPGMYSPDQFRSADHDPLVMGLTLTPPPPSVPTLPMPALWAAGLLLTAAARRALRRRAKSQ